MKDQNLTSLLAAIQAIDTKYNEQMQMSNFLLCELNNKISTLTSNSSSMASKFDELGKKFKALETRIGLLDAVLDKHYKEMPRVYYP
ncbi:hypothetical protein ACQKLP_05230 [Chitinophaga sp. NPDC101104]|uniref:hypothetical protein n=1 Tax=Chitinophaga sp. NPDC101104 TaxID=3390561 RepID=UPI003D073468